MGCPGGLVPTCGAEYRLVGQVLAMVPVLALSFRSIDQLRAGDEITVTTGQGRNSFAVIGCAAPVVRCRRRCRAVEPALVGRRGGDGR